MMRFLPQKLVSLGVFAVYGGIAVLGHGLHELSPAHHHHHEVAAGPCVAHHHGHDHHHFHCHDHAPTPTSSSVADSHDCEICVFLDQIRSAQPQFHVEIAWQPFVVDALFAAPRIYSQATAGLHSARGPPAYFG